MALTRITTKLIEDSTITNADISASFVSGISGSFTQDMTLATASIAAITSSISRLDTEVETNESNITLATASIAAITASVSTINDNMTLATASIAAITASVSTINDNMTLATASIAAITASLGQPVNTDSDVTFGTVSSGDITSTGTITAVEVHTTYVSSSIAVASGSNNFGDDTSDHHSFTGSLSISGSLIATGSATIEGTLTADTLSSPEISLATASIAAITSSIGGIVGGHALLISGSSVSTGSFGSIAVAGTGISTFTGGKVGIGTDSPATRLDITQASFAASAALRINNPSHNEHWDLAISSNTGTLLELSNYNSGTTMVWNNDGNVGIGISTLEAVGGATARLQVEGTGGDTSSVSIFRNTNNAFGSYLTIGKSRGGAVNADTIVVDNDILGTIQWAAADGTDRQCVGANIFARVNGTPGSNDMPTELVFGTTADGADAITERMYISSTGNVGIGATSISSRATAMDDTGPVLEVFHNTADSALQLGSDSGGRGLDLWSDHSGANVYFDSRYDSSNTSGGNIFIRTRTADETLTAIAIDQAGRVTKPQQPAFSVMLSGTQSNLAVGASYIPIQFDTDSGGGNFNQGDQFNTTSYEFVAPVTGKYQFNALIQIYNLDTAADYYEVLLETDNKVYDAVMIDPDCFDSDVVYWYFNLSVCTAMDAGDTAQINMRQLGAGSTAQADVTANSVFSGYLVC